MGNLGNAEGKEWSFRSGILYSRPIGGVGSDWCQAGKFTHAEAVQYVERLQPGGGMDYLGEARGKEWAFDAFEDDDQPAQFRSGFLRSRPSYSRPGKNREWTIEDGGGDQPNRQERVEWDNEDSRSASPIFSRRQAAAYVLSLTPVHPMPVIFTKD